MFDWFTKDVAAVENRFKAVEADAAALQTLVTQLSGGLLTAQTEINFIKGWLASQGITIPAVVLPVIPAPVAPVVPTPAPVVPVTPAAEVKPQVKVSEPS